MTAATPAAGPNAELKTGTGITSRSDRVFKRGTLMFIEGESGREMYIMRTGKVKILKQEGDRTVELAVLGPGSVLGELSLLDNQPRGATGQVIEEVIATVIDEAILEATMAKIPAWLGSVIKIVVSRLRETNKRNGDDIVKNNIAGVINIMLLLQAKKLAMVEGRIVVPLARLKEEVYSVTGVSSGDTEKVLTILILKEMVVIAADHNGKEYARILNAPSLQMYLTYLRVKLRGGKMIGEGLSAGALDVARLLLSSIEHSGKKQPDGKMIINIPQLELQMQREGKGRFVDPNFLDELISAKIVDKVAVTSAMGGTVSKGAVSFEESKLQRMLMLCALLPVFKEDVVF